MESGDAIAALSSEAERDITRRAMLGELADDADSRQLAEPLTDPCRECLKDIKARMNAALGPGNGAWVGVASSETAMQALFDEEAVLGFSGRTRAEVAELSCQFWKVLFERRGGIPLDQAGAELELLGARFMACCDKISAVAYEHLGEALCIDAHTVRLPMLAWLTFLLPNGFDAKDNNREFDGMFNLIELADPGCRKTVVFCKYRKYGPLAGEDYVVEPMSFPSLFAPSRTALEDCSS